MRVKTFLLIKGPDASIINDMYMGQSSDLGDAAALLPVPVGLPAVLVGFVGRVCRLSTGHQARRKSERW